jgi:hypothetical protein
VGLREPLLPAQRPDLRAQVSELLHRQTPAAGRLVPVVPNVVTHHDIFNIFSATKWTTHGDDTLTGGNT